MRVKIFLLFFFVTSSLISQQKFSKEFSLVTDNDLYVSTVKDQYYTNGLFLTYRYLSSNKGELSKKIFEIQIGHEIYTPYKSTVTTLAEHDRPFAGYLYANIGVIRAYKTQSILKTNLQLGVLGEDALGENLQNFIHDIYNFRRPFGWKYQIRNTLALNFDTEYIKALDIDDSKHYDINFMSKLRIGTIFNEVTGGFIGRIGFKELQPIDNSLAFNTHLNNDQTSFQRGIESFLYYKTSLTIVAYDATIQGSLFNSNSPVTYKPKSLRFDLELGLKFTSNRCNFGYAYHYHSNKLNNLRRDKGNDYGQIFFSYLFN
ncbi:lipid A deacylase LpxR family protein [Pseudotenacibaculum sp. MALMAid0570]|uniref:lipid A deacylase LpxR family protein n=1 Tax=Pseudotenacibaculum sp. MALMAid0570 TaxID=3143938 RepID=UPI0032DE8B71